MYDINDMLEGLRKESREDITRMLAMTWYHQIKARQRVPEIMDRREALMERWLTGFDLGDAAELILLITQYDLKGGDLPEGYDPEEAEAMYGRLVRTRDEVRYMDSVRALGLSDQRNEGLGREIRIE